MEKARAWVIEAKDKLAMRELDILEPGSRFSCTCRQSQYARHILHLLNISFSLS